MSTKEREIPKVTRMLMEILDDPNGRAIFQSYGIALRSRDRAVKQLEDAERLVSELKVNVLEAKADFEAASDNFANLAKTFKFSNYARSGPEI